MNFTPSIRELPNDYFIIVYVTEKTAETEIYFMEACLKLTNMVSVCNFKTINLEKTNNFMCKELGAGYVNGHIKQSDYLICLMNKSNASLAGFLYGKIFMDSDFTTFGFQSKTYPEVILNVDVLCGHELLRGAGYILILFVQCLTFIIAEKMEEVNFERMEEGFPPIIKNGFILESVPDHDTQSFYNRNNITPINKKKTNPVPHLRYWHVPNPEQMSLLLQSLKHSNIKLKKNTAEKVKEQLHMIELNSPRSPRLSRSLDSIPELVLQTFENYSSPRKSRGKRKAGKGKAGKGKSEKRVKM